MPRISGGVLAEAAGDGERQVDRGDPGRQEPHLLGGQGLHPDVLGGQVLEDVCGSRVAAAVRAGAPGEEQQELCAVQPGDGRDHRLQRCGVGMLGVVDRHHQGLLPGRLVPAARERCPDRRGVPPAGLPVGSDVCALCDDQPSQQRPCAGALPRQAAHDHGCHVRVAVAEPPEQCRLPDPRRALEDRDGDLARTRPVEQGVELGQRRRGPDQQDVVVQVHDF